MQYHIRRKKYYYGTLLTRREVKMARYWPRSFLRFNWTKTKSRSIKTQKGKKATILQSIFTEEAWK